MYILSYHIISYINYDSVRPLDEGGGGREKRKKKKGLESIQWLTGKGEAKFNFFFFLV